MGEFTNGECPSTQASQDKAPQMEPGKVETDVKDVYADGTKGTLHVFKVSKPEFYQNMQHGRKRVRFKVGSSAGKYMQGTRYNRPFYIEHDGYVRKVK